MKIKKLLKEFCLRFVAGLLGTLVLALVALILYGVFKLIKYFIVNWSEVKHYFLCAGIVVLSIIFIEILGTILLKKYRKIKKRRRGDPYKGIAEREEAQEDSSWSEAILEHEEQKMKDYAYEAENYGGQEDYYEDQGDYCQEQPTEG